MGELGSGLEDLGARATFSIEELSEHAGLPARTVRYYQTEGLLPHPARHGRRSAYTHEHLRRLQLIGELQRRGLRLAAIREVLVHAAGDDPGSLSAWVALGHTLWQPWVDDAPALLTETELRERLGERAAHLPLLEGAALVERRTDTRPVTYLVPSTALLSICLELTQVGVSIDATLAAGTLLRDRIRTLTDELVTTITEDATIERLARDGLEPVAEMVDGMRPLVQRAVGVMFSHEMERALREIAGVLTALRTEDDLDRDRAAGAGAGARGGPGVARALAGEDQGTT